MALPFCVAEAAREIIRQILVDARPDFFLLEPSLALREGMRSVTSARGQHRLHSALVVTETALGLMESILWIGRLIPS